MEIQELTRQKIIDELILLGSVSGSMSVSEFVRKVFPKASNMPTTDMRFGMTTAIDDIRQHMDYNQDWNYEYLFYEYLDLLHVDDSDFKYFLEQYVNPRIQRYNILEDSKSVPFGTECVDAINKNLSHDGFELKQVDTIVGLPVYSVTNITPGVQGTIKNIIFASKYKPEIVLEDALNNNIRIISNQEQCLVFDRPISQEGVTWNTLNNWYDEKLLILDTGKDLIERLRDSLNSPPEILFYNTYIELAEKSNRNLPALFPQVWLYYDPKLEKDRIRKIFDHQRMDFLMIFSEAQRIVIEIDGIQHYSDYIQGHTKHYASVDKYAEMVAAHREMSLAGYDVYRFGGKELYNEVSGKEKVKQFFKLLFSKYGVEYPY